MRTLTTLSLMLALATGCRSGGDLAADAQILDDMENLAIELVYVMENSWCEDGNPGARCYLDAHAEHTITHASTGHYDRGEYDIIINGVPFDETELEGQGTVAYDWDSFEVSFEGLMSVNDSAMYSVDILVNIVDWDHYEVEGRVDDEAFDFTLRRRTNPYYGVDDGGCRGVELGITCE